MTQTSDKSHRFESPEATRLRADELRPVRQWVADGCTGPEPAAGLAAALTSKPTPVELTAFELEYIDALTGAQSMIDTISRPRDAPSRTELRRGLIERGILVASGAGFAIAPQHFPTVGIALFAPRATGVSVLGDGSHRRSTFARSRARAVSIERDEADHLRITPVEPSAVASLVLASIPLTPGDDVSGRSQLPINVSRDDLRRARDVEHRQSTKAAIAAFPALHDYIAANAHWSKLVTVEDRNSIAGERWRTDATLTATTTGLWLVGTQPGSMDQTVQQVSYADALAHLQRYAGEPGVAYEHKLATEAIRPPVHERWRALPSWQRLTAWGVLLVAVLGLLNWVTGRDEFGLAAVILISLPAAVAAALAAGAIRGLPFRGSDAKAKTIELPRQDQ